MPQFPFLADRPDDENNLLLAMTRAIVLRGAVREGLIKDDDLALVPEVVPILVHLAGELRDDFYRAARGKLSLQATQRVFCYAFGKGAEAAILWHESSDGRIDLPYRPEDPPLGRLGLNLDPEDVEAIQEAMPGQQEVFVDVQDHVFMNEELGLAHDPRRLADAIACAFFWSMLVGLDFGMARRGMP